MGMTIIYLSGEKKEGEARIIKTIVIRTRAWTGELLRGELSRYDKVRIVLEYFYTKITSVSDQICVVYPVWHPAPEF